MKSKFRNHSPKTIPGSGRDVALRDRSHVRPIDEPTNGSEIVTDHVHLDEDGRPGLAAGRRRSRRRGCGSTVVRTHPAHRAPMSGFPSWMSEIVAHAAAERDTAERPTFTDLAQRVTARIADAAVEIGYEGSIPSRRTLYRAFGVGSGAGRRDEAHLGIGSGELALPSQGRILRLSFTCLGAFHDLPGILAVAHDERTGLIDAAAWMERPSMDEFMRVACGVQPKGSGLTVIRYGSGRPDRVHVDNARDFQGIAFREAAAGLGVNLSYEPEGRAAAGRRWLLRDLAADVGSLDADDVRAYLERWVALHSS